MTKRIAVIGAGTAGALAAAFFSRKENFQEDVEVRWYADPNIPTQAVGEGSNLAVPINLLNNVNFTYNSLHEIDGTFKSGIAKYNWGKKNSYYFHDFPPPSVAYHFNAVKLQQHIAKQLTGKIEVINDNVTNETVDADYIINCSGRPKAIDENFYEFKTIPVNSVFVTQCFWDYPRFQHTLTIARPYGWVFGIPLQNRCSIGYLYNNKINTIEEVKEDVKNVFQEFSLSPSDTINSFSFYSYCRRQNFTDRVAYNGNASFFSEPLEATTIGNMVIVNNKALKIFNKTIQAEQANRDYLFLNQGVVDMISLHYFAGSRFDTEFWRQAKSLATRQLSLAKNNKAFRNLCLKAIEHLKNKSSYNEILKDFRRMGEHGTWGIIGYATNIDGLGVAEELEQLLK